jgi:predicted TIM-barrel fold metal-dependent hydrolase
MIAMDRREFIGGSFATLAVSGSALTCSETLCSAEDKPMAAIDAHVHLWDKPDPKYPLAAGFTEADRKPLTFTPDELFHHCKPQGVQRIVLIQMNFFGFDNSYMMDCIRNYPGVFAGVAVVDENQPDVVNTMKELAKENVRGFRLYADKANVDAWSRSEGMKRMWEYGAESGLSMCLLSNPDALPGIDALCTRFPKTPVVIDHFSRIGGSGSIPTSDLDALCKLARFPNVNVKTSAFYAFGKKKPPYTDLTEMIRKLLSAFGAKRLMWASDCPYQVQGEHTYAASIGLIRDQLDFLTAEDKEWMLAKTASKVFFT